MAKLGVRALAASVIAGVLADKRPVDSLLIEALELTPPRDQGLLKSLCYGTVRSCLRYQGLVDQLLQRPLKAKDKDIYALLLVGCHQLLDMRVADHAALSTTVDGAAELGKVWAKSLVNGVLRQVQRRHAELLAELTPATLAAHPLWLYDRIESRWPEDAQEIIASNNAQPPMFIRVNSQLHDRKTYQALLVKSGIDSTLCEHAPEGLMLDSPVPVDQLPGFESGWCSVQDASAQLAAKLLPINPGQLVLDACSAPGGKACHLLEKFSGTQLTCLDSDAARLLRVEDNLERIGLQAACITGNAQHPEEWWDGRQFDHILLDAPCTGTGVIRRNPDIKIIRQPGDIPKLARLQEALLRGLWPCLRPGGTLLYATCSIMPEENAAQIGKFLEVTSDAIEQSMGVSWGIPQANGRQILPSIDGGDGFFYARIYKPLQSLA